MAPPSAAGPLCLHPRTGNNMSVLVAAQQLTRQKPQNKYISAPYIHTSAVSATRVKKLKPFGVPCDI